MSVSVFCIASNSQIASDIVTNLKSASFTDQDISVLYPDKTEKKHENSPKQAESAEKTVTATGTASHEATAAAAKANQTHPAVTSASTGGMIGGTLGLIAGITLLAIPGVGPILGAGPIIASIGILAAGAALGGVAGGLVGMGIPENEAKRFEGKVKGGSILISVRTNGHQETDKASYVFKQHGGTDIATGVDVANTETKTHTDAKAHTDAKTQTGTKSHTDTNASHEAKTSVQTQGASEGVHPVKVEVKPGVLSHEKPNIYADQPKHDKKLTQDKPAPDDQKSKPLTPTAK